MLVNKIYHRPGRVIFFLTGSVIHLNFGISGLKVDHRHPLIFILLKKFKPFANIALSLLMKRLNLSQLRWQAGHVTHIPNGSHCLEHFILVFKMETAWWGSTGS